mgnify:CR=1 FL=1
MFDTGNTGFMLVATSLVMLMTPGLAFFYGGLVGRKNVLTIMMQSFVSLGITTIIWYVCCFSLCFSGGEGGIIGNLDLMFLKGITPDTPFGDGTIPMLVFVAYQMMFAIITPALITGAFSNRVRFPAYLLFLVAWLLFVYFPFVHMVWGGGLLAKLGEPRRHGRRRSSAGRPRRDRPAPDDREPGPGRRPADRRHRRGQERPAGHSRVMVHRCQRRRGSACQSGIRRPSDGRSGRD